MSIKLFKIYFIVYGIDFDFYTKSTQKWLSHKPM